MIRQKGLIKSQQRLQKYLIEQVKLSTEKFRFGDTHGEYKGSLKEEQLYYAEDKNADTDWMTTMFNPAEKISQLETVHEHFIHLIVADFIEDLDHLLHLIVYWIIKEKMIGKLDYTLKWNNNSSIDLHIYIEIYERSIGNKSGIKTC